MISPVKEKKSAKKKVLSSSQVPPAIRPLKIFSSDPMLAREPGNRISINIQNEFLSEGPRGSRFEVLDYDGTNDYFYKPVNLNDPSILMQGGLEPAESDPQFHQQMVYAVAMRTLENFQKALGRRIEFRKGRRRRLALLPHAFHGANAFYDRKLNAILFGYFCADRKDPGPNLPGQIVFTCLSHDIIVHEMTHALVDRLRPLFLEPSNVDVLAFHEGFSDIISLFQHFSFQEFLRDEIQRTQTDIRKGDKLVNLARQFGYAIGINQALRSAINKEGVRLSPDITEPHDRGSILVAAVFTAFLETYRQQIQDLIRISTGGSIELPRKDLHPDLVNRIAHEASKTAQSVLTMCIRAFDYLPPVDITFGDFLRALVTADYELAPSDEIRIRSRMIEAFRTYGIYPENVLSLAEESLIWPIAPSDLPPLPMGKMRLASEIALAASAFSQNPLKEPEESSWGSYVFAKDEDVMMMGKELIWGLLKYAKQNAKLLFLDPREKIGLKGFNAVFRVAPNGQLLAELVVQYIQEDSDLIDELGGIPFRGGTTIITGADGRVRYVIAKPISDQRREAGLFQAAKTRLDKQREYLQSADLADARMLYENDDYFAERVRIRMNLQRLHQGL